jgi:glycogen synthase
MDDRMTILLVSAEYGWGEQVGGIGAYVSVLAPALARVGHDVHVLSCTPAEASTDIVTDGVAIHMRPLARVPESLLRRAPLTVTRLRSAWSVRREVARLGISFDVIEAPNWGAEHLLVSRRPRALIATSLVTPLRFAALENHGAMGRDARLADNLERLATSASSIALADSHLHNEELRSLGWLRHDAVHECWLPVPTAPRCERAAVGDRILQVGRLEGRKRPELTVAAAARLRSEGIRLLPTFVGGSGHRDGRTYSAWLADYADKLGVRIDLLGRVPPSLVRMNMEESLLVCQPSGYESFGLAAAEGMAAGLPAVVTSRSGIAPLVRSVDPRLVVPPDDVHALAAAIRMLARDREQAADLGSRCRDAIERHLAPAHIARRRIEIYRCARAQRRSVFRQLIRSVRDTR